MPPNCELRGRGLQRALNVDSSRLRRKDAAMVYIPQTHHQVLGVGISATCCEASKHVAADRRIASTRPFLCWLAMAQLDPSCPSKRSL
jgi:hypothetical protein